VLDGAETLVAEFCRGCLGCIDRLGRRIEIALSRCGPTAKTESS
jgi:hypothetical protein